MSKILNNRGFLLLVGLLLIAVAAAACGGGGTQEQTFTEHTFTIEIQTGKPVEGAKTFQVKQGDTVTFNVSSDTEGELHLHGYDLTKEMAPGKTVSVSLTANATGRFPFEIEDTAVEIGFLEVLPR